MNTNPLYDATRAYVDVGVRLLARRCEPEEPLEWTGLRTWARQTEDWFHLRDRATPWWALCISENQDALEKLPERRALCELLKRDPDTSPMIGHLVGVRLSSQILELNFFTDRMMWLMVERTSGLAFDEGVFDELYPGWEAQLRSPAIPIRRLAPLNGFTAPGPIRLGSHIVIDRMTDDEIVKCLEAGLIPSFPNGGAAYVTTTHSIRWESDEPRIIGGVSEADGGAALAEFSFTAERMRATLETLRVFKAGHVSIGRPATRAFVAYTDHWAGTGATHWSPLADLAASDWPAAGSYCLDGDEADRLARFSPQCDLARQSVGPIDASVRRFALAAERAGQDDRILDLVIAMEGLFLSDLTQGGELGYRFALRGACLLTERPDDRGRGVLTFLKAAYAARSAIAHGRSPKLQKLVMPDGSRPQSIELFADSVEATARDALQRSVDLHHRTGAFVDDWDRLVLGESNG
jgi:Apea-like HEPN